jgi:DNA-binding transcriptional regulator YdaS (Cro superfamily)
MADSNLKITLQHAELTTEQFADIIGVDPKTVQRWVAGRTPYPRHRTTIARALDRTEHELWPHDVPAPAAAADNGASVLTDDPTAGGSAPGQVVGEVIGSWGQSSDPGSPPLMKFVARARARIDILDANSGAINAAGLIPAIQEAADAGCTLRVIHNSGSDSAQESRELLPGVADDAVRVSDAPSAHALVRADDEMLVLLALAGTGGSPPLLHLRRQSDHGIFERLVTHFEAHWDQAATARSDVNTSGPTSPPRRWPRRPE